MLIQYITARCPPTLGTVTRLDLVTEAELDRRYRTAARLSSGGDYGLGCLVGAGDPAGVLPVALDDEGIGRFFDEFGDVGTILIDGDVRSARHIVVFQHHPWFLNEM